MKDPIAWARALPASSRDAVRERLQRAERRFYELDVITFNQAHGWFGGEPPEPWLQEKWASFARRGRRCFLFLRALEQVMTHG